MKKIKKIEPITTSVSVADQVLGLPVESVVRISIPREKRFGYTGYPCVLHRTGLSGWLRTRAAAGDAKGRYLSTGEVAEVLREAEKAGATFLLLFNGKDAV